MSNSNDWHEAEKSFGALCETIAALRHPETGCPWDLEQTHSTLRKYMIEEAYEAAEVMEPTVPAKLKEELGDVLLQVVLNAQLAKDTGTFTIQDVIKGLNDKMRRRHPHVFGHDSEKISREKVQIRAKWEEIKAQENGGLNTTVSGVFSHLKPASVTPASQLAITIGKVAKKIQFDWNHPSEVLSQVESEVSELKHEIMSRSSPAKISAEMGDVFFSLFQLCRHLDIDPEICAMDGNKKFITRFQALERIAAEEGCDVMTAGAHKLEDLWQKAKARELGSPQ